MNLSLTEIRRRRGALVERARSERASVRALLDSQRNLFGLVDVGVTTIRFLAANKGLLLVATVAFAVVQPRRSLRWAGRAWGLYRLVRRLRRAFAA